MLKLGTQPGIWCERLVAEDSFLLLIEEIVYPQSYRAVAITLAALPAPMNPILRSLRRLIYSSIPLASRTQDAAKRIPNNNSPAPQ